MKKNIFEEKSEFKCDRILKKKLRLYFEPIIVESFKNHLRLKTQNF